MSETFYTVKPGDSLSLIAKNLWGDPMRYMEIFEANRDQIKDPNLIRVGQKLRIPGAPAEPAAATPAVDIAPAPSAPESTMGQASAEAPAAEDASNQEGRGPKGKQYKAE